MTVDILTSEELKRRLHAIGAERYHVHHPFHRLLHDGKLSKGQVQAWALNRFYYQSRIPMKDAALMARVEDPELRRIWRQRIIDHDGNEPREGGIERWLVWGGSWGVTLALAYAERHPERVTELVLVSITMTRRSDVRWFAHETGRYFPEQWQRFRAGVPEAGRDDLVAAYDRLLNHESDGAVRHRAARDTLETLRTLTGNLRGDHAAADSAAAL